MNKVNAKVKLWAAKPIEKLPAGEGDEITKRLTGLANEIIKAAVEKAEWFVSAVNEARKAKAKKAKPAKAK